MKPWTDACSSRAMPSATRRSAVSSAVGRSTTTWSSMLAGQRARRARPGRALGGGEHPRAPVVVGRREVVRADDHDRAALGEVGAELGRAGEDVPAIGHLAPQQRAQERRLRGLGGTVGGAEALDLGRDHRRRDPQDRRRRPAAARAAAAAARPPRRRRAARASRRRRRPASAGVRPPDERAATASTELERSIRTSDASRARAAARTTSGRPRPDSTASDMAPSAPRSGSAASLRAGEVTPEA